MIRNLFAAALLAALVAGLSTAAIQQFRVTPLILQAETFEGAEPAAHDHGGAAVAAHDHGEADQWAPQDGFERTAYTTLATVLVAAGYALLLGAVAMFANLSLTARNGVLWGLAGFVTFSLAPAFGLAPELPGMPAADLVARQVWWVGTALATGAACVLLARTRASWAIAVAVALVVAPHLIGAPAAPDAPSAVPAHLATAFAAATLGTSLVFWLLLGVLFGKFNDLLARQTAAQPVGVLA